MSISHCTILCRVEKRAYLLLSYRLLRQIDRDVPTPVPGVRTPTEPLVDPPPHKTYDPGAFSACEFF